jgi:hemerythrin-like domain-containing protein
LLQLASEHAGERTLVDAIEEALLSRRGMAFFRSSRQLTALLRSHCEKEDAIVYTLAERYLSKELDDEIAVDFMANRAEAESHADLSRLEARYLPKPSPDTSRSHQGFARTRGSASYR